MKAMKILSIFALLFGFTQCASLKLEKKAPFVVTSAVYNHWVGGMPGVSGTKVEIRLENKADIVFDSLYFLNRVTKIEIKSEKAHTLLIANYSTSNRQNRDIILDSDPKKEVNNKIPDADKFPFELKENEAVISYKEESKTKYFKISNLKKTAPDLYPEMRK